MSLVCLLVIAPMLHLAQIGHTLVVMIKRVRLDSMDSQTIILFLLLMLKHLNLVQKIFIVSQKLLD